MARKVSGGLTGSPSVGALNVAPTAVVTAAEDQNITLSPTGTGSLVITANAQLQAQSDLRFADSDSSNWVAFQAPATVSSNVTWTLPAADGSNNQVLTTNASGTLSWTSKDVAIVDQTASATVHYVTLTTSTSGVASTLNVSSTKLSFQPSTGALTATTGSFSGLSSSGTISFSGTVGITATTTARQLNPEANNTYDLGTTGARWRTIYTTDLELSNGIGDYTIVEGEEDLFIYNNKNGKTYKFMLQEVDKSIVPAKKAGIPGAA
jgi:hypothetical protein